MGTAVFSLAEDQEKNSAMPGRPSSGRVEVEASVPANTMAIAAHPGDAFFTMGAPVALSVRHGGHGVVLSLSLGERGSSTIAPARYGALQREAAESAARRLGAQAEFLSYPDGEIPASDEAKLTLCDLIRRYRPNVILTHWQGSWHKDHVACYEIVKDAIFYAGLPALVRELPAHNVPKLYFADNWEDATGFAPDTYLDIVPVFDGWLEAVIIVVIAESVFSPPHGKEGTSLKPTIEHRHNIKISIRSKAYRVFPVVGEIEFRHIVGWQFPD